MSYIQFDICDEAGEGGRTKILCLVKKEKNIIF